MKRLLTLIIPICVAACSPSGLKLKLAELDSELDRKEVYVEKFEGRMDSLRRELQRTDLTDSLKWETAYSLFSSYSYVNVDSTKYYLGILDRLASTQELRYRCDACHIRYYGVEEDYDRLFEELNGMDPGRVSEGFRQRYFDELQRACVLYPGNTQLKKDILNMALEFSGLSYEIRTRYQGLLLLYDEKYTEALPYFALSYHMASNDHIKALASYNQATCHNFLGDKTSYCQWLAQAAIYDIRVPVSDYSSLLELSEALYEKGNNAEALKYIEVAMSDAIEGNWESRILFSAKNQKMIFDTVDKSHNQLLNLLIAFIIFLLASVGGVSYLLLFTNRQNRELLSLNQKITEINSKLKDEGRIKENYLFKYMEMSVEGIGKLEDYRHKVRQVLKEEGADALTAMLRAPRFREEYKEFYKNFDNTFLNLYPDFIKQVNNLMKEEEKFKEENSLSTDLRIIATIRLGFNDSGQIARFLNIPPTSVYTRRSAIRRNSRYPKDEFYKMIMQIT